MDRFELLLADRLRTLARELRIDALLAFKESIDKSSYTQAPELKIIFERWEADNQLDSFIPKALAELTRIAGFVKVNG